MVANISEQCVAVTASLDKPPLRYDIEYNTAVTTPLSERGLAGQLKPEPRLILSLRATQRKPYSKPNNPIFF